MDQIWRKGDFQFLLAELEVRNPRIRCPKSNKDIFYWKNLVLSRR